MSTELMLFLQTETAKAEIARLMTCDLRDVAALSLLTRLRRRFSAEQAGALLTLARLRVHAAKKFPQAERMFFTSQALEQATPWPVALFRAERMDRLAPPGTLLDLGCGVGGDTLALAQFRPIIAYEHDPERLYCAQANAAVLGLADRIEFRLGDWVQEMAAGRLTSAAGAFVDPARRSDGRRRFHVEELFPPLSTILLLESHVAVLAVKLMPGVDEKELPASYTLQFVSHERVCKEAVLWRAPALNPLSWASVHTGTGWFEIEAGGAPPPLGALNAPCILYEPDPAVIRAGAIAELCAQLNGWLFDRHIAYIIAGEIQPTPFAQPFVIHEVHPFDLKLLNQRLAARGVGQVELKRRGFPVAPEELRPRLQLAASVRTGVVILTRRADEHLMLIAERVTAGGS